MVTQISTMCPVRATGAILRITLTNGSLTAVRRPSKVLRFFLALTNHLHNERIQGDRHSTTVSLRRKTHAASSELLMALDFATVSFRNCPLLLRRPEGLFHARWDEMRLNFP